jgi:hypothetical protein
MDNQIPNPNTDLKLPEPVVEQLPQSPDVIAGPSPNETVANISIEQAQASGSPLPPVTAALPMIPDMPPSPVPAADPLAVSPSSTPAIADDNDLIEKEWIEKAKMIVETTKADPHLQNKEINRMKADYIKKRYNKEIKLSQD